MVVVLCGTRTTVRDLRRWTVVAGWVESACRTAVSDLAGVEGPWAPGRIDELLYLGAGPGLAEQGSQQSPDPRRHSLERRRLPVSSGRRTPLMLRRTERARDERGTAAHSYIREVSRLVHGAAERNAEQLRLADQACAATIGDGGLVHLFALGHSALPVLDLFPP